VYSELERLGFVGMNSERMSLEEQIAAFRDAKLIVAEAGAGLTNLLWCEAGTRVAVLYPSGLLRNASFDLWKIFGNAIGVDVRSIGGDLFSIGMNGLRDTWGISRSRVRNTVFDLGQ